MRLLHSALFILHSTLAICALDAQIALKNSTIELAITEDGNLATLANLQTGQNYAGGHPLWRLYFDTHSEKEQEVLAQSPSIKPQITKTADTIILRYDSLEKNGQPLQIALELKITLENNLVRFSSKITNNEPHTIIRELHYPLVGNLQLPSDHKLLTAQRVGRLYDDPVKAIPGTAYFGPDQHFKQMPILYPRAVSANCFVFPGERQGLYLGSHDATFQDTWHGVRLYEDGLLEAGLYKYPNCFAGETWENTANVIAPYSGTWHQASKIYRAWVDTWWSHEEPPLWVKKMTGWQRIILRHQYGETFFRYTDLPNRILQTGLGVGCDTVLAFGWWNTGMDNGYPDYSTDPAQGGDAAWKKAIADTKARGGRLLLYFNGKLIDRDSDYFKNGDGQEVSYNDNTGAIQLATYKFRGMGTSVWAYNSRSFSIADTRNPKWRKILTGYADIAYDFGADSVFYDQLGYGEEQTNWDLSREFPVPNLRVIADKADALKAIREHIKTKNAPDFALGTEWFTDVTAQHVDYVHLMDNQAAPNFFIDWTRYTFPEVIISDREIYDDTDVERRVNLTVLLGLRNDIDIYRCRDLIDKTPVYQAYLTKINQIKTRYSDLLLLGRYCDTEGFATDNPKIMARSFSSKNQKAIVLTQSQTASETCAVTVPGYRYKESSMAENAAMVGAQKIVIGKNALAVLIYEKIP